jgi:Rod binding domain-containing protein
MNVNLSPPAAVHAARLGASAPKPPPSVQGEDEKLRRAFQSFVGQALFGQMLKAMRKTLGKPAYFHGGRAEEIFQQQLDQVLAEKISNTSAQKLSEPMFELFVMKRR